MSYQEVTYNFKMIFMRKKLVGVAILGIKNYI